MAASRRYKVARETKRIILALGIVLIVAGAVSLYTYTSSGRELLATPSRANTTVEETGTIAVSLVEASVEEAQVKVYYDTDGECNQTLKTWETTLRVGESRELEYNGRLRLCGVIAGVRDPVLQATLAPYNGYYETPGVFIANFSYPTIKATVKVESRYRSLGLGYQGPVEVEWQRAEESGKLIAEDPRSIDFASVGGWVNWYEVYTYSSPPWTVWLGIAGLVLLAYYTLGLLHERRISGLGKRV
ncbi:MAG: hypothetical protein GSR78_05685 [Desulfurococcales archaeon]|nr:hypothetical protein [Desulfurococcales archaeon]